jgi:flagellar hook protein FlgE
MANYTIGLAGLQNTSLAIDTTSNNIANANTVGYKAGDYVFADQYFKAVSPSDSNRVGLGSQRLAVRRPLTYGTINNSANPLDMAIGGDGWFRVLTNPDDPTSLNYTRNGQFAVDKNGWIVNENGMYLTGYQPSKDGLSMTDDIRGLGTTNGKLRMPADFANGTQTSTSKISATLDSRENAFVYGGGVAFDPAQNTFNSKTTQTIFDSNGNSHTLEVYYRRISDNTLAIVSDADGYHYAPGKASAANTGVDTAVYIPGTSSLSVQTPAVLTVAGKSVGQSVAAGNSGSLLFDAGKTTNVDLPVGTKIFMNGLDTGMTVKTLISSGQSIATISTTGTPGINVPAGASFTFYPADATDTATAGASAQNTVTLTAGSSDLVGRRLFTGSTDTGLTVLSYDSTNKIATLSGNLSASAVGAVTFKKTLDMTLSAPDGTSIVVKGTTNRPASNSILTAVRSNVEVYAALDGTFYDYQNSDFTSNKDAAAEVSGVGASPYRTVATMGFIGGRNIDSLVTDNASGKPVFSTIAKLSARVLNGSQQSATSTIPLIFNLDLSGTQLQASTFQVSQSAQDGEPRSQLASVSIDGDGTIVGVYGNGRKLIAGQIALAHFDASEQLVPTGGNSFAPSYRSGTEGDNGVRIGRPGEGSFGAIKSQAVEQSNVDLSNELVKLMLLQRVYSANSQSLRAFDQTMQDTIRMVG